MSDERKNKLIDLGTVVLADALLKLAEHDDWQNLGEHGGYHVWLNQVHG